MKPIFKLIVDKIKKDYIFTLADVGAMGGYSKKWDFMANAMNVLAFEPDEREFNKLKNSDNVTYFNCALYNKSQELKFYITKGHGISSIYKPNLSLLAQFENIERFHIEKVETLPPAKVNALDSIVKDNAIKEIDFIKLDTQGSELQILEGCLNIVIPKAFGMQIEVEFIEIYKNQPLFRDVDEFMYRCGFQLVDIRRQYWKRKDYYDYEGKGQLIFGDALWVLK